MIQSFTDLGIPYRLSIIRVTYNLTDDGQISLISGDVLTGSGIEGGEIANCWVAFSPDGKTLWTANALSSSISTLRIRGNGTASLVNDVAYKDQSETLFFSDMAVGNAGKELFQLVGNKGEVMIFGNCPGTPRNNFLAS